MATSGHVSGANLQARRQRLTEIQAILHHAYPDARCALVFANPLELLIATILSAQCTDSRVNAVTRSLFQKYHMAADYVAVAFDELAEDIRSTGFFRQKARSIQRCCEMLLTQHDGHVPDRMEALVKLPGVGRKTANVLLGNAFQQPAGIAVDTHVKRLSQRLELTHESNPDRIEDDLMAIVPRDAWTLISHLLILHGRQVCKARKPQCESCQVSHLCPSARC